MNTLGRTVKEGANQSNKSNQSDLFPGMSKFSDIKDNKLWAQTVLADQIITIINKIPDNIRSLNAKKKVTHADLMSMYKLVGQCFRQLSYSELDE
jgi:hypothetical protein